MSRVQTLIKLYLSKVILHYKRPRKHYAVIFDLEKGEIMQRIDLSKSLASTDTYFTSSLLQVQSDLYVYQNIA